MVHPRAHLRHMNLESLKHVRRLLPNGGKVVVIDTGALIGPEAEAMIQALHSRSIGGVDAHLVKLAKSGAEKFMSLFYVGYGHKSIGDCGSTTIFIEGVSILAAKAIQDYRLYNGQEASTRYIDFAQQVFIDPLATSESRDILESWRTLYLKGLERLKGVLRERHAMQADEDETKYAKAINARAFDIMRGFLPAGASTNLAWHTELRHASDHLMTLRHHPLNEVRLIAQVIEEALMERFPSSFSGKHYPATEDYNESWMGRDYYFRGDDSYRNLEGVALSADGIWRETLKPYRAILETRPMKTELPKFLGQCGTMMFEFLLDFGSFRDLQRQRSVVQRMPLIAPEHGIGQWYLQHLPDDLRGEIASEMTRQLARIETLHTDDETRQYYLPMGLMVPCRLTGDLPAVVYIVELRSGISVHPTLRTVAQQMGALLLSEFADFGLKLYLDMSEDRFNVQRGLHDIVERT
ncbi:FAD-dependent thymidylate synthase [Candidatus Kaiserbacteria bacterium]|nr:FAD-dependent thymidylate synthase [Candidatus Kaiserbacteria bacterium]